MRLAVPLCALCVLGACKESGPPVDASADAALLDLGGDPAPDAAPPACGSAERPLPQGLVELKWDKGTPASSTRDMVVTVEGKIYQLALAPLHEAVRFELDHPARIHGFSVQWTGIAADADPATKLEAGLYRDFGHNGFDFWAAEPLWTGTRCVRDVAPGSWLTYVFNTPVELTEPGLVYVAHRAEPDEPTFFHDDTPPPNGTCEAFGDCHSAVNLPTVLARPTGAYYNGVSYPLPQSFLVRLYVEYTEQLKPAERMFQKQSGPSSSSASVSFGDYDNDGWDDLLVGGTLYHNNQGVFADVTQASGIAALNAKAAGGVWGDYDNDSCLDLFLFAERHDRADTLLRGDCTGAFTDVTVQAGIVDQQSYNDCGDPKNTSSPSAAAAWLDIDADGYLDLYIANFLCWGDRSAYVDTVFRNKGDGTFEEQTAAKGFLSGATPSRGAAPADQDGDGDVDLFVNNYVLIPNLLFANNGDGTVTQAAAASGAAGNATKVGTSTYYGHTIGAAWGDLDNDGDLDLVAANLAHPRFFHFSDRTQVLLNDGKGHYTDASGAWDRPYGNPTGLRYQETHSVPVLGDFDADGKLDLVITCIYDGRPTDFYRGNGDGTFTLDAYRAGISTTNGWGAAASDYDNDGDLDLFATDLFRNERTASGHWLQVRAVGNAGANRAAIGSTVRVKVGSQTYTRHVQGGTGKGCQDSMYLFFGLGAASSVDEIQVTYPGGKTVTHAGPFAADQRVWVYEDGSSHSGWAPKP